MSRKKKLVIAALAAALLLLAGAVVVVLVAAEPVARSMVQRAARDRGVLLDVEHVDVGWGWVRLREASLTLDDVPGFDARFDRATVDLEGTSPTKVEIRGLSVRMTGSAARFVVDLGSWAQRYPDTVRFPVVADDVRVEWRETESSPAWLSLSGGFVAPRKDGSRLTADRATVLGVPVGPAGAVWTSDNASVTFGFGNPDPATALVRMDVDPQASTASVALRPVRLADLARPLGVRLPIDGDVMLEGRAELSLTPQKAPAEVKGAVHAKLRGYVPPHPRELDGIVFGDVTTFDSDFRLAPDRRTMVLERSRVAAGAFVLAGKGTIEREQDHALIAMDMGGDIPCAALAKSAAVSRLGGTLGKLLGDAAKRSLAGSVRVGVRVRADSRKLDEAKVSHDVTIGCTVRFL